MPEILILATDLGATVVGDDRALERAGIVPYGGDVPGSRVTNTIPAVLRYARRRGWTVVVADELQDARMVAEIEAFLNGGEPKRAIRWIRALEASVGRTWRSASDRLEKCLLLGSVAQSVRRIHGWKLITVDDWNETKKRIETLEYRLASPPPF